MGAKLKKSFYREHPGILQLIEDLERAFDSRGYLIGFDGRPLQVRGKNKLLNTLLQHTAAIVFKEWMVKLDLERRKTSYLNYIKQVIGYHDELQYEASGHAEEWGVLCESVAREVGKELGMLVPIEAKSSVGDNWGQTH